MTRQRYSIRESLNRILRLFQGNTPPSDAPETLTGDLLSENEAVSDLAEILSDSLPGQVLILPTSIQNAIYTHFLSVTGNIVQGVQYHFGNDNDYLLISASGTVQLFGNSSVWKTIRIDGLSARNGVVAPTDEVGFRGDNNFLSKTFVNTQADEVQINFQLPHDWKVGTTIYPHVHFSPWITGTATNQAVRFVMEYYRANEDALFIATPLQYLMTKTWTGSRLWYNLGTGLGSGISGTSYLESNLFKCRIYRDNTVTNNLAGKVSFLYVEIHYESDSLGSNENN